MAQVRLAMARLLRRRTRLEAARPRLGRVRLRQEDGLTRCTACALCAANCPSACIHVEAMAPEPPSISSDRRAAVFELNLAYCIDCGLCERSCPVDAIRLDGPVPSPTASRADLVHDMASLSH